MSRRSPAAEPRQPSRRARAGIGRPGCATRPAAVRGLGAGTLRHRGASCCCWRSSRSGCSAVTSAAAAIGRRRRWRSCRGVLAGMMRRPWAWYAGTVLQGLLLLAGLLHWSLFVLGVIFGLVWATCCTSAGRSSADRARQPDGPTAGSARHWVIAMSWPSGSRNAAAHSSSFAPRLTARGA